MSTIEKLFVQIFDRKRQIIEQLKHRQRLYDQHLLSKLLLQGIPPPPWLLGADSNHSTADLTVLNKEELIAGLLLPKPPVASYNIGTSSLYDKDTAAAESTIPDESCAVNWASSYAVDEEGPGVAPLCHVDSTEAIAGIPPPCHVDGSMDTFSYVPMSPEDQSDTRFSNACQLEQSHVSLHRSRSRQKALELRNSAKENAKSCLGMENNLGTSPGSKTGRYDEHLDSLKKSLELADPSALSTEPCSNKVVAVENSLNMERSHDASGSSLVPLTGSEAILGDCVVEKKSTVYDGRTTRSRSSSRQPGITSSGSKNYGFNKHHEEQLASLKKSLVADPSALSSEPCSNEVVAVEDSLNMERSHDASSISLVQLTGSEAILGDGVLERKSAVYDGRITRSRSSSRQPGITSFGSKSYGFKKHREEQPDSLKKSLELADPSASSTEPCSNKVVAVEDSLNMERSHDASSSSLVQLTGSEAILGDCVVERKSTILADPSVLSTELCSNKVAEVEDSLNMERSHDASGSSLVQLTVSESILGDCVVEKKRTVYDGRITRSRSSSLQPGITSSGSKSYGFNKHYEEQLEVEASSLRSKFGKDVSVKPKQLDFDEVASNSCNVPMHLQDSFSSHEKEGSDFKLPDFNFNHAMDGSWPGFKRRKIECQNLNKSAHPTLRTNPFHASIENFLDGSASGQKENIPPTSQDMMDSHNLVAASLECAIAAEKNDQSITSLSKEHRLTPQVQCEKYKVSSARIVVASTCEHLQSSEIITNSQSVVPKSSDSLPENEKEDKNPQRAILFGGRLSDVMAKGQDVSDGITASRLTFTNGAMDQRRSPQRLNSFKFSIGSPQMERMNVTEGEQSTPEFEGFIIGESTVNSQNSQGKIVHEDIPFLSNMMDMTSIPEHDSTSASSTTPVSPFPTACKLYFAPGIYSSVPNGLLENNNLQGNLLPSGSAFLGKSHSDMFSFPGGHYGWDSKKPFLSPSGKSFESIAAKSAGSDKLGNSDLELTCFPILEDPESSEEDVYDAVDAGVERTESEIQNGTGNYPLFDIVQCESSQIPEGAVEGIAADLCTRESGNKETICDITAQCESSLAPEDVVERGTTEVRRTDSSTSGNMEPFCDINVQDEGVQALDNKNKRQNVGSLSTKISNYGMHNNKKSGMGQRTSQPKPGKENKGFSFGANSSKKTSKTLSSRFSKPKLSGQSNLRSSEKSVLEKEQKRNNIVSSIKSFLPLVQQKQAAAVVPEKRDLKVKALQAAEAAKRAAEVRENERQQKKEAMKLERAKVEQENLKKLELKKKLKEEQQKKREAENAAKKRQREEEDRKEKERKKRRVEEARLQHKQAEEKLHAWKEQSRCAEQDIRAHEEMDTNEKTEKQFDTENERGESGKPVNDLIVVENDKTEANVGVMSMGSSAIEKVSNIDVAESTTPKVDKIDKPNQTSQSYDLSPYQDSDDEEEEEDEMPTKKFVPSWASKSCVASVLSLQHLDPDTIFLPGSFCSLEEVLLPRRLQQK